MTAPANLEHARFNMIEQQIRPWDVLDPQILELLSVMKREDFVPLAHKALAFVDMEIPLLGSEDEAMKNGHCMLAPRVEARMLQQVNLKPTDKVLEIGAGSGYMAALLARVNDDKDTSAIYLNECRRMGIKVLPPDVNDSDANFTATGSEIRFGLSAIRNVGGNVVESIIASRTAKGRFTDFSDFLRKIDSAACNKRVVESLVKAGSFDSLGHTRRGLAQIHAEAVDAIVETKRAESIGQYDLFVGAEAAE